MPSLGSAPVEGQPAQRRFQVRRADVFARWLLSFGGDAVVVSPSAIAEEVKAQRLRTLVIYRDAETNVGAER
jgi:predicted DNA-binding transcriptional regulator YafY